MYVGLKIKIISELISKYINNSIRTGETDVTFQQMSILKYLSHNPGRTASLKELEKNFGTAQATMAGMVVRLEEKGLVNTFHSEEDKRVKMVRLSDQAWKFLKEHRNHREETESAIVSDLKPEEIEELDRLLNVIYGTVSRLDEEQSGPDKQSHAFKQKERSAS